MQSNQISESRKELRVSSIAECSKLWNIIDYVLYFSSLTTVNSPSILHTYIILFSEYWRNMLYGGENRTTWNAYLYKYLNHIPWIMGGKRPCLCFRSIQIYSILLCLSQFGLHLYVSMACIAQKTPIRTKIFRKQTNQLSITSIYDWKYWNNYSATFRLIDNTMSLWTRW